MKNIINDELIETTYLFCYKRLCNKEDAEDLAQEILCEALKAIRNGKNITSFYSWYWRMAHNRYATFLSYRSNQCVELESYGGVAADFHNIDDNLISKAETAELNYAISRLSSIYRDIIILFYLKNYSIADISKKLNIPIGTVKRRLFDAKKNLKERFETMNNIGNYAYAPASMNYFGGYNCSKQFDYMKNLIVQQILIVCRMDAKTINEIADKMGVAPIYLESYINSLIELQLLKEASKGKYLSDICVFQKQPYTNASAVSRKVFFRSGIGKEITNIIYSIKDKILSYDFYGKNFSYEYLMWIIIVYACDSLARQANEIYIKKYEGKILKDNGKNFRVTAMFTENGEQIDYSVYEEAKSAGWSNLHNWYKTAEYGKIEYINDFQHSPFPERNNWITANNVSLLLKLAKNPNMCLSKYEEEMAADFISKGIVSGTENGLKVELPIIDSRTANNRSHDLRQIIHQAVTPLAEKYERAITKSVEEILLPYVRKDLLEEFVHWNMRVFLQPTGSVFHYAIWETDILPKPESFDKSAAGLWIMIH